MTTVIAEQLKDCQDTDEKPKRRLEVHTARAWLGLTFASFTICRLPDNNNEESDG